MERNVNIAHDREREFGVSPLEHIFQKARIICLDCKAIRTSSTNSFWL